MGTTQPYRTANGGLTSWWQRVTRRNSHRYEYDIFAYGGVVVDRVLGHHRHQRQREIREVAWLLGPNYHISSHLEEVPQSDTRICILVQAPKTEVRHVVLLVLDAFQTIKGGNADDTDGGCFIHFLSLQDERGQMEDIENYIKSVVEKDERKYEAFFIKGGKFGSGGFKHSDIELSNINWMRSAPDFVTKFEQKLDNKPGIVPAARNPIDFVRLLVDSGCQCRRITHLNLYLIPNLGPHILGLAKNLANSRGAIPIRSRPSISLTLRLGNGRNAGKAISDVP